MSLVNKIVLLVLIAIVIGLLVFYNDKIKYTVVIAILLFAICIWIVLSITLFDRHYLAEKSVKLIPGYSFRHIIDYPWQYAKKDAILANLGNAVMFIPFGMIITYLVRLEHPYLFSGVVAFAASMSIEITQYCLQLGSLETDDIIYNTWGSVIGCSIVLAMIKKEKSIKANIKTLIPVVLLLGSTGIICIISITKDCFL